MQNQQNAQADELIKSALNLYKIEIVDRCDTSRWMRQFKHAASHDEARAEAIKIKQDFITHYSGNCKPNVSVKRMRKA